MPHRYELRLPELGFADQPMTLSLWLVEIGAEVAEGDRLAELLAGCATVDLPSPASGVLAEMLVDEDETVVPGQLLAVVVECSSEGNNA